MSSHCRQVRVLELVDQERAEPPLRCLAHGLVPLQEVARHELEIFEVERRLGRLRLAVGAVEFLEEQLEKRTVARRQLLERGTLDARRAPR